MNWAERLSAVAQHFIFYLLLCFKILLFLFAMLHAFCFVALLGQLFSAIARLSGSLLSWLCGLVVLCSLFALFSCPPSLLPALVSQRLGGLL